MKNQKHTTGQWKVNTDNNGNVNTVYSSYHGAICSFPKFYGVKETESGKKELEANASLIASAPEMLDVLLDLRDGEYHLYGEAWAQIDRVIKKATL